jgi:hypothetical protein
LPLSIFSRQNDDLPSQAQDERKENSAVRVCVCVCFVQGFSTQPTGCNHYADPCVGGCGALIMAGDIKLVKGPNGGEWTNHTNGTISVCEKKNGLLRFSHLAVSQNLKNDHLPRQAWDKRQEN